MNGNHGIYIKESPTSIISPKTSSTVTVAIGIAPIHLASKKDRKVNTPILTYSEGEVAKHIGLSKNTEKYGLSEVSDMFFKYTGVAPVVFINVLDPKKHKVDIENNTISFENGEYKIDKEGVLLETIVLAPETGTEYKQGIDYVVAFDDSEKAIITMQDISIKKASLKYSHIEPNLVTKDDIIGGEDASGVQTGMELITSIYSKFKVVPRQLIHPSWMTTDVIAAGYAKMQSILGTCKGMQWVDIDTEMATDYTMVASEKANSNIIGINQIVCWPKVGLGGKQYYLSTVGAARKALTDTENDNIPSESPSNKTLSIDSVILSNGKEVILDQGRANLLNENGIVTVNNLKLWGNYTAARSETTDVKDTFIPIRDMFNWVGISIVLTYANKIDKPGNLNLIETITDSQNIWLNGLTASGHLYGGKVLFRQEDNPLTSLLNGRFTFKLFMSPVIPMQEMVEDMEYDPSYLNTLFA